MSSSDAISGLFGTVWGLCARLSHAGAGETGELRNGCAGYITRHCDCHGGGLLPLPIPAFMSTTDGYQRVNKLELNYDNFMEEFCGLPHRGA